MLSAASPDLRRLALAHRGPWRGLEHMRARFKWYADLVKGLHREGWLDEKSERGGEPLEDRRNRTALLALTAQHHLPAPTHFARILTQ